MIQDELQQRIHDGQREAFREIYGAYSRQVYALAQTALGSAEGARAVVRQVFLTLYRELMHTNSDIDLPARLSALTNEEIRISRIAAGDLSPDALQAQCTVSAAPGVSTDDVMLRIRARMAGGPQAETAQAAQAMEPAGNSSAGEGEPKHAEAAPPPAPADPPAQKQQPAPPLTSRPAKKAALPAGGIVALVIAALLLLFFVWLLVGILMELWIIPFFDLGYRWFNENVFSFFWLP